MAAINATLSRRYTDEQIASMIKQSQLANQEVIGNWNAIDPITESVKKARAEQLHMLEEYAETLHTLIANGRQAIKMGRESIRNIEENIDQLKADSEAQHRDALRAMERNLFSAKTVLSQQTRMVAGVSSEYAATLSRAAAIRLETED